MYLPPLSDTRSDSFATFANFRFDSEAPLRFDNGTSSIPMVSVQDLPDIYSTPMLFGSYTTVMELNERQVAKISRLLRMTDGQMVIHPKNERPYLVKRTGDLKRDRDEVVMRLVALADLKRTIYDTVREYIGAYLPKVYLFAIVESPRREIERLLSRSTIPNALLRQFPLGEISLMEVCERVNTSPAFDQMSFKALRTLYGDAKFQELLVGFANSALRLLVERRIMLDICDWAGIK